MRLYRVLCLPVVVSGMVVLNTITINAETINLRGKVSNSTGEPIANAIVAVMSNGMKDTTGADGMYAIHSTAVLSPVKLSPQSRNIVLENGSVKINLSEPSAVKVEFFTIEGKLLKRAMLPSAASGSYRFAIDKKFHANLFVIRVSIGQDEYTFRSIRSNGEYPVNQSEENSASIGGKLAKTAGAIDTLEISANKYETKKMPLASYDQQLDITLDASLINRNVIFSEGFEGSNLDSAGYTKLYNPRAYGIMSVSTNAAHSGKSSLTSDSNNTGIRRWLENSNGDQIPITDSIAGFEFYLMAKESGKTDFFAAIVTMGTSAGMLNNGFSTLLGMGIDKSDSLWYTLQKYDNPQADSDLVNRNFAALKFNKWYKCGIEYDFTAHKVTYFLDDTAVYTRSAPGISKLDMFIASRDSLGAQGPKDYFIDDITIYKR